MLSGRSAPCTIRANAKLTRNKAFIPGKLKGGNRGFKVMARHTSLWLVLFASPCATVEGNEARADGPLPEVAFAICSGRGIEGRLGVDVWVTLSRAPDKPVKVDYRATDGTAIASNTGR